jgi:CRP-like cAMP-binding protein
MTPTEVIVLDKPTYDKVIKNVQTSQIAMVTEFLSHIPAFQCLKRDKLEKVAAKFQLKRYPTNTLMLRQDDLAKSVYYVLAGRVKVLRKVDFRVPLLPQQHTQIDWLSADPTPQEYAKGLVESKLLELDEMHNGDFFGDACLVLKEPIKHSLITAMPTEMLTLDIHDFLALPKELHENSLLMQKAYPDDSDLRRAFIEMNRWTKFKQDMLHSIRSDSINKRRTFENQLRKPVQMPAKLPFKAS